MTHTEAYTKAGQAVGLSRAKAKLFIEAYLKCVETTVMADQQTFRIEGFLAIKPKVRNARIAKRPGTTEPIQVPKKLVAKITPKAKFKRTLE